MLWLAGLLGIAGVGAASLISVEPTEEPEEDQDNIDEPYEDHGNLLDDFQGLSGLELARAPLPNAQAPFTGYDQTQSSQDELGKWDEALHAAYDEDYEDLSDNSVAETLVLTEDDLLIEEKVLVGDWISQGQPSEVFDYTAETESLMLVWDDMGDSAVEPEVNVVPDPDDHEVMHVLMNDRSVAEVYGDPELTVEDVTVIPLSSALIVGLEPA